jgi:outer membrane biosynthesis protein TonB
MWGFTEKGMYAIIFSAIIILRSNLMVGKIKKHLVSSLVFAINLLLVAGGFAMIKNYEDAKNQKIKDEDLNSQEPDVAVPNDTSNAFPLSEEAVPENPTPIEPPEDVPAVNPPVAPVPALKKTPPPASVSAPKTTPAPAPKKKAPKTKCSGC